MQRTNIKRALVGIGATAFIALTMAGMILQYDVVQNDCADLNKVNVELRRLDGRLNVARADAFHSIRTDNTYLRKNPEYRAIMGRMDTIDQELAKIRSGTKLNRLGALISEKLALHQKMDSLTVALEDKYVNNHPDVLHVEKLIADANAKYNECVRDCKTRDSVQNLSKWNRFKHNINQIIAKQK